MLALVYFGLAICLGDWICRRFYQFASVAHRCAAAVLVGLLVSSWFTYLAALAFTWASQPMVWGNLLFFLTALAALTWPKWKRRVLRARFGSNRIDPAELYVPPTKGSTLADWLFIAGYVALVS